MNIAELCLVIITIGFVVLVVFLIQALVQLKKTAGSVDALVEDVSAKMGKLDQTVENVRDVSQGIKGLIEQFGTPVARISAVLAGVVKGISVWWETRGRREKESKESPKEEEDVREGTRGR